MFRIDVTNSGEKDIETCLRAGYGRRLGEIISTVREDPFRPTQGFKRLKGDLKGFCARKINRKNRFVYSVHPNNENARDKYGILYDGIVRVHESWGHEYNKPI